MSSEARIVITNPTGLHARPAVKLARLAAGFDANIEIRAGEDGEWVRARSTARVMKLKAGAQSTIHFRAEGSEAEDALSALIEFVRRDFDEGPAATARGKAIERLDEAAGGGPGADESGIIKPQAPAGDAVSSAGEPPAEDAATTLPERSARPGETARESRYRSGSVKGHAPAVHAVSVTEKWPEEKAAAATVRASLELTTLAAAGTTGARLHSDANRTHVKRAWSVKARTPAGKAAVAARAARGGDTVSATVASPGLALGVLHLLSSSGESARRVGNISAERAAFDDAVAQAVVRLGVLGDDSGKLARDVIGFQISLLEDEEFLGPVWTEIEAGIAADRAWTHHLAREIADYESAPTAYLRERAADLRDLRERVAMAFADDGHRDALPERCVVIAHELPPSRFLELDRSRAVAVATYSGSPASHVAMLARAYGLPMLVQLTCDPKELTPGAEAVVDADRGCLVLAPPPSMRADYALRIEERRTRDREAARWASRPARTREGTAVQVLVNVDDPAGLVGFNPSHCDGIGLTRTEFLFHGQGGLPDEETQLDCYRRLVAWARGRPVTVRTLDAGGDKPIPGLTLDGESNPFLGLRGVRLSLSRPEVFATQLRALARAAVGAELKVMLPMVTKPDELDQARRLLCAEVHALRSAGIEAAMPRLGMMVEVPAAALSIETFDADFFSIGTNDLTQYVFAAGRDSSAVADLLDPLHPAVLMLIARVAEAGARAGREVSVCGEMAARPEGLRALLEAGIRMFSVPPAALAATKATLAAL